MLTKRAYDERVFHVDMSPVLRRDDSIAAVVAVLGQALADEAEELAITSISAHARAVSFRVGGGTALCRYQLVIQVTTADPAQEIEGVIYLDVQ